MKSEVTKKQLIMSLEKTLKLTRTGIESLELVDEETVIIHFEGGGQRKVSIACDSGIALIGDICRVIE
jgi:predicted Ser/Thr protein kinase